MKITKRQLRRIIKEEIINEQPEQLSPELFEELQGVVEYRLKQSMRDFRERIAEPWRHSSKAEPVKISNQQNKEIWIAAFNAAVGQ